MQCELHEGAAGCRQVARRAMCADVLLAQGVGVLRQHACVYVHFCVGAWNYVRDVFGLGGERFLLGRAGENLLGLRCGFFSLLALSIEPMVCCRRGKADHTTSFRSCRRGGKKQVVLLKDDGTWKGSNRHVQRRW